MLLPLTSKCDNFTDFIYTFFACNKMKFPYKNQPRMPQYAPNAAISVASTGQQLSFLNAV